MSDATAQLANALMSAARDTPAARFAGTSFANNKPKEARDVRSADSSLD